MASAIPMRAVGPQADAATARTAELHKVEEGMNPPLLIKRRDLHRAPPTPAGLPPGTGARLLGLLRAQLGSLALSVLSIALLLGFWYLGTEYRWDFYIRFTNVPSPGEVFTELMGLFGSTQFQTNIGTSVGRILSGFCIATALGVVLGLLCGRYAVLKGLLFPALFSQPGADAPVTFNWPGVTYVLQVLRLWA